MNQLEFDYANYQTIISHKGYCFGYNSEKLSIDMLKYDILQKFKNYFLKAQGIYIKFKLNKKQPLNEINFFMEEINNIVNDNLDLFFDEELVEDINIGQYECFILFTGFTTLPYTKPKNFIKFNF